MKLPDFLQDDAMNALRAGMAAPLCDGFRLEHVYRRIELPVAEQLGGDGVELDLRQLEIQTDGTLAYGAHRVLLYIRDPSNFQPRFHVFNCLTLQEKQRENRFDRYVAANSDSTKFVVNFTGRPERGGQSQGVELKVCQHCLTGLNWKGFTALRGRPQRQAAVEAFNLQEFFERYPKDLVPRKPRYTADTAPLNDYPADWEQVKTRVRKERGYQCQACHQVLLDDRLKYLHVHHRNGLKYDSSSANLELLCIACHAQKPGHAHMKALPDYLRFTEARKTMR